MTQQARLVYLYVEQEPVETIYATQMKGAEIALKPVSPIFNRAWTRARTDR